MVSVPRQWNTWDQQDPLAMVHLPTGFCLRFSAFSNEEGAYRRLGIGDGIVLLEHLTDGGLVRAHIAHAGSELELAFAKPAPHALAAHLTVLRCGEWGLRYWLTVEAGFLDAAGPAPWRSDEPWIEIDHTEPVPPGEHPRLTGRHRSLWVSVASQDPAVFGGTYAAIEDFAADIAARGYYAPPRAERPARWGVLRFNAQMHPTITVAAALGTDRAMAAREADAVLAAAPARREAALRAATQQPAAAQAVRDVIAWNTVWDAQNHRTTTVLTRNWLSRKFAGWGVWLDDMLFHALLAALVGDWENTRGNLAAALEYLCPEGNLACLRTATQEWVDRSQSPIGAYVLWRVFLLTGDRTLLAQHFPVLLRAHRWWLERRDPNGDGLIEYGSSPTGTGAFVHTKQAAMDESLMDNAPIFDDAGFDPARDTMTVAEPGLSSLVSLDAQCLARIATELGDAATAATLRDTADRINRAIAERLWDEQRGTFAARHWNGAFVASLSPTCFYPLLAGAASEAQTARMIEDWLLQPSKFWGARVLPSSTHDDPASADNVYWRGRIWPPHLFLVWEGLRRAGRHDVATDLADRAWTMFDAGWGRARLCYENYHRHDPAGDASPDADPFYSWGALIPAMRMLEAADASPWEGRVFACGAATDASLAEAGRYWRTTSTEAGTTLSLNGSPALTAAGGARLRVLRHDRAATVLELLPAPGAAHPAITLHGVSPDTLRECSVNGAAPNATSTTDGLRVALPPRQPALVRLHYPGYETE